MARTWRSKDGSKPRSSSNIGAIAERRSLLAESPKRSSSFTSTTPRPVRFVKYHREAAGGLLPSPCGMARRRCGGCAGHLVSMCVPECPHLTCPRRFRAPCLRRSPGEFGFFVTVAFAVNFVMVRC